MKKVVGITLGNNKNLYYFLANNLELTKEDEVVVETERGTQFGLVASDMIELDPEKFGKTLKSVLRAATPNDKSKKASNEKDSIIALEYSKEKAEWLKLDMQLIDASYTLDRKQLLFTFVSTHRVDFRELAKELAKKYKTRIELHQIGPRDKAKKVGGVGPCGRELCCATHLAKFESVSINMAKEQNISLNPAKINGLCGRLLCCLKYENDNYKDCKKCVPKVGTFIKVEEGNGKVISVDVLTGKCRIDIKDKGIIEKVINNCGSNK